MIYFFLLQNHHLSFITHGFDNQLWSCSEKLINNLIEKLLLSFFCDQYSRTFLLSKYFNFHLRLINILFQNRNIYISCFAVQTRTYQVLHQCELFYFLNIDWRYILLTCKFILQKFLFLVIKQKTIYFLKNIEFFF